MSYFTNTHSKETTKHVSVLNVATRVKFSPLQTHVVFVDLTAACNTVRRKGLSYKLNNVIRCWKKMNFTNNVLTNRNLKVFLWDEISKNMLLNNELAQGSFLSHLVFSFIFLNCHKEPENDFVMQMILQYCRLKFYYDFVKTFFKW